MKEKGVCNCISTEGGKEDETQEMRGLPRGNCDWKTGVLQSRKEGEERRKAGGGKRIM